MNGRHGNARQKPNYGNMRRQPSFLRQHEVLDPTVKVGFGPGYRYYGRQLGRGLPNVVGEL